MEAKDWSIQIPSLALTCSSRIGPAGAGKRAQFAVPTAKTAARN
jgi:hypothetical protein